MGGGIPVTPGPFRICSEVRPPPKAKTLGSPAAVLPSSFNSMELTFLWGRYLYSLKMTRSL